MPPRSKVASAFVLELRTYCRLVTQLQAAAEKKEYIRSIGFSRHLYETLLAELPLFGSVPFLAVRAAYQQLAEVNYLLEQFAKPILDTGIGESAQGRVEAEHREKIANAYVPALKTAAERIEEALTALRAIAPGAVFDAPLPKTTELSAEERALFGVAGH